MDIYQRLNEKIYAEDTFGRIKFYHILGCSPSELERFATLDNESDPRREMAREVISEMFLEVFIKEYRE